jgi:radical SAM protein with 4Fe4S-binding SPASM domain
MNRPKGIMKEDLLIKILTELPNDVQEVCLSLFGEPLMDKHITLIMKTAREMLDKSVKLMFFTNGSLLNNEVNNAIYKYLDEIVISFQGYDKESYQKNTMLDFLTSYDAIANFLKNKPGALKASVVMLDMNYTNKEKDKFRSLFAHYGKISPARNWDKFQTGVDGSKIQCGRPQSLNVLYDGRVVLCCRDFNATVVLGNLNRSSIKEVWDSPKYKKIRQSFANGNKTEEICRTCYPT